MNRIQFPSMYSRSLHEGPRKQQQQNQFKVPSKVPRKPTFRRDLSPRQKSIIADATARYKNLTRHLRGLAEEDLANNLVEINGQLMQIINARQYCDRLYGNNSDTGHPMYTHFLICLGSRIVRYARTANIKDHFLIRYAIDNMRF